MTIAVRVGYVVLILTAIILVYPAFKPAKVRGGPTPRSIIHNNLMGIDDDKEMLRDKDHLPDDYWPTRAEITTIHTGKSGYSFDEVFKRSSWGEVYIINRIGAPAYAYLSNAAGDFREGRLLTSRDFGWGAQPEGSADESQLVRSATNGTPSAAGSRR